MLIVMGGLAEFECELIRARTGEGRKPKLTAHQPREALQRRDAGEPIEESPGHITLAI